MTSETRPKFPVVLTLASLIAFAILCGLGTWQLQRLAWKSNMLARVEAARNAAPRPLAETLARGQAGADIDYANVEVACPGLAAAPFVEVYALDGEGKPGSRLVSACRIDAGGWRTILVDRGFVSDGISARPPVDTASKAPLTVRGVLRAPGKASAFAATRETGGLFHSRDIPAMAAALKAPAPASWFLMAETPTNPEWAALKPAPLPVAISNRHLEYAVTWFGLAVALVGVYAAMLWKRFKSR